MGDLTKTKETTVLNRNERIYAPRVDIIEGEDQVVLYADMPGVSAETVHVTLEKSVLTIEAETEHAAPDGFELVHREFRPGGYRRAFTLSDDVDRDNITAQVSNGVLKLTLPKVSMVKTRRIAITS